MATVALHPREPEAPVAPTPALFLAGQPAQPGMPAAQQSHRVSVIIPALNEAENLPHVLPRIPTWVDEVILVDGHSTDDTVAVAQAVLPSIRIIMQEGRGKGAALRTGFAAATGDIVVMVDADGSTDPAEIPAFVGALLAGADFVKGSRFLQGAGTDDMPLLRKLGNWALTTMANTCFGTHYTDITYGFNAAWRRCAADMALEIDGWANEIVTCLRVASRGLSVVEVASFEHERIAGTAKLSTFSAGWTILKAILNERLRAEPRPICNVAAARARAYQLMASYQPAALPLGSPQLYELGIGD